MSMSMRLARIWLVAALLLGLGSAAALAQDEIAFPELDDASRAAIVDSLSTALLEVYVFPEMAEDMDRLMRERLRDGAYDGFTSPPEFADRLTEDLRSVCHDLHLRVWASGPVPEYTEADEEAQRAEHEAWVAQMAADNFGFAKLEILPGNVGYVKLNGFNPAEYGGDTAIAAMNFLSNTDAIIFDLRENGGGSPSMIQLISSYLFEHSEHLNSFYIRQSDETKQFWSTAHVDGPKMSEQPVYVLTSSRTFSAAEEFTYNLKNMERATIVGETTGGGAHPVNGHYFNFEGFAMRMSLPFGRAINPITGTNWEGTGVAPDIEAPVADALLVAHRDALVSLKEGEEDPRRLASLDWGVVGIDAKLHPFEAEEASMRSVAGDYGPRHVRYRNGGLFYHRDEREPVRMIPLAEDLYGIEGMDTFRLHFVRDENGEVQRVEGLYRGGRRDGNERTGSS